MRESFHLNAFLAGISLVDSHILGYKGKQTLNRFHSLENLQHEKSRDLIFKTSQEENLRSSKFN